MQIKKDKKKVKNKFDKKLHKKLQVKMFGFISQKMKKNVFKTLSKKYKLQNNSDKKLQRNFVKKLEILNNFSKKYKNSEK